MAYGPIFGWKQNTLFILTISNLYEDDKIVTHLFCLILHLAHQTFKIFDTQFESVGACLSRAAKHDN
jgi:hypothetical protein